MAEILTLGYTGMKMDRIQAILERRNAVLIDVRFSAFSRAPVWSKKSFQATLGDRYWHLQGFGNRNFKGGPMLLHDPEVAFGSLKAIMDLRTKDGAGVFTNVALMCGCADVNNCHRKMVAYFLADRMNFTVTHLTALDIMGAAGLGKEPSEATLRRRAAKAAALEQTSLLDELPSMKPTFVHRDDS